MGLGDGADNLVSYDLATLTRREVLRAHLRGRFPQARDPVLMWIFAVVGLTLGLAGLGFIVGMALWPRFRIETMVVAFGMTGPLVLIMTLAQLQRAGPRLRAEGRSTTGLTPEGIIRSTRTKECKYYWMAGQKFVTLGDDVLIFVRGDEILWLPRRVFASPDAIDSFLLAARNHHANALTRLRDLNEGVSIEVERRFPVDLGDLSCDSLTPGSPRDA